MKTASQHNLPILGQVDTTSSGPRVTSGRGSKQDYATPWEFIHAVEGKFGKLGYDLAASEHNHKADRWITEESNSLLAPWAKLSSSDGRMPELGEHPLLWLNPPFGVIGPWAQKCLEENEKGARILLLTPAAVGSNWFANFVHRKAMVYFLSPRIMFDGADDPYPKDLILSYYGPRSDGAIVHSYETWRWKP